MKKEQEEDENDDREENEEENEKWEEEEDWRGDGEGHKHHPNPPHLTPCALPNPSDLYPHKQICALLSSHLSPSRLVWSRSHIGLTAHWQQTHTHTHPSSIHIADWHVDSPSSLSLPPSLVPIPSSFVPIPPSFLPPQRIYIHATRVSIRLKIESNQHCQ